MGSPLSASHLSNRNFELQRKNNFEVVFEGISDDISLAVTTFSLPSKTVEKITLPNGNSEVKVAGKVSYASGNLVVRDAILADIEKKVNDWHELVHNSKTDSIGFAADYKKNGTLYEYSPDGKFVRTWTLIGCWPSTVSYGDMDSTQATEKTITITVEMDKAYRN